MSIRLRLHRLAYFSGLFVLWLTLQCGLAVATLAQGDGVLRGKVTLANGDPLHNIKVTIIQLKRSTETNNDGAYEFQNVPPGRYDVSAHLEHTPDILTKGEISAGQTVTADFEIKDFAPEIGRGVRVVYTLRFF